MCLLLKPDFLVELQPVIFSKEVVFTPLPTFAQLRWVQFAGEVEQITGESTTRVTSVGANQGSPVRLGRGLSHRAENKKNEINLL